MCGDLIAVCNDAWSVKTTNGLLPRAQSNSRGEEQGPAERWVDRGGLGGDDYRDGDDDWNDDRLAGDHREGDNDDPSFGDDYQRGHARATGSVVVARDGSRAEAVGLV
ncbi:unnamed protein product [Phytophthora fragariaefolia]|uniref:Unnamed protein product n=1 Tax=Phytophthora fragariaefolia TaxID=1490495 RepID=A0A9W6YEL0_9STRA|nr:unnamed protein product [Phytophthora fragariaefolia]